MEAVSSVSINVFIRHRLTQLLHKLTFLACEVLTFSMLAFSMPPSFGFSIDSSTPQATPASYPALHQFLSSSSNALNSKRNDVMKLLMKMKLKVENERDRAELWLWSSDSAVFSLWPTYSFRHQHVSRFTASRLNKPWEETNSTKPAGWRFRGGAPLQLRSWNMENGPFLSADKPGKLSVCPENDVKDVSSSELSVSWKLALLVCLRTAGHLALLLNRHSFNPHQRSPVSFRKQEQKNER